MMIAAAIAAMVPPGSVPFEDAAATLLIFVLAVLLAPPMLVMESETLLLVGSRLETVATNAAMPPTVVVGFVENVMSDDENCVAIALTAEARDAAVGKVALCGAAARRIAVIFVAVE